MRIFRHVIEFLREAWFRLACRVSKGYARRRAACELIDHALERGQVTIVKAWNLGSSRTDIERYDGRIGTAPFRLAYCWPKFMGMPRYLGLKVFCGVHPDSGPEEAEIKAEVRDLEESRNRLARFYVLVRERASAVK